MLNGARRLTSVPTPTPRVARTGAGDRRRPEEGWLQDHLKPIEPPAIHQIWARRTTLDIYRSWLGLGLAVGFDDHPAALRRPLDPGPRATNNLSYFNEPSHQRRDRPDLRATDSAAGRRDWAEARQEDHGRLYVPVIPAYYNDTQLHPDRLQGRRRVPRHSAYGATRLEQAVRKPVRSDLGGGRGHGAVPSHPPGHTDSGPLHSQRCAACSVSSSDGSLRAIARSSRSVSSSFVLSSSCRPSPA